MKLNILFHSKLTGILLLTIFASCTGKKTNNYEAFKNKIEAIQPKLMQTSQVAELLASSEAEFLPEVLLPTDIIDQYMQDDSLGFTEVPLVAMAKMGMYTADVAYLLAFNKKDSAFTSYSAAQVIANELGFGDIYVKNLISRHNNSNYGSDSTLLALDKAFEKIGNLPSDTARTRFSLAFLIGNYLQKQYIINATLQSYNTRDLPDADKLIFIKELVAIAIGQANTLPALIELLENNQYASDPGLMLAHLKAIQLAYNKLVPISDNPDDISSELIFNNPDFNIYFENISAARTLITDN